jgi:hypothetical protein
MLQRSTCPLLTTMLALMLYGANAGANAGTSEPAAFDPGALKGPAKGVPNEVMVLGTAHLKYLPPAFQPASLDPLLARLRAWKPRIIAIENLSGSQCAFLRQYPQRYADTVKNYCWDPAPAHAATGLDVLEATQEAERLLAAWPPCSWPAANRCPRWCSGCDCRKRNAAPVTAWMPPWPRCSPNAPAPVARTR